MKTQSEFLAITCNLLKAQEESRVQGEIDLGFSSRWLKNWCKIFNPVSNHSNNYCNHIITFDNHLITVLLNKNHCLYSPSNLRESRGS